MLANAVTNPLRSGRAFAPSHPADGALFLIYIALICWQVIHGSLYLTPAWLPVAKWLLGH